MPMIHEVKKPVIHFFCTSRLDLLVLKEIQYGMEEEGIPWVLEQRQSGTALDLAWEAAKSSNLEVGIGADEEWIVLHYNKLEQDHPLFRISARSQGEARALGANAARLVKKLPLKALEGR